MEFSAALKELRIVETFNKVYLGILRKDEIKDDILVSAMECNKSGGAPGFTKHHISSWMTAFNVGNIIEEIRLPSATSFTVRGFDVHEQRYADQCLLLMEDAKQHALADVQNTYFSKLIDSGL